MNRKSSALFSALLVFLLLFQSLANVFPVFTSVSAETERMLRIHLETDQIENDLSLWMWGDVLTESGDASSWPSGSLFSESDQTDFGYYQDIAIQADAEEIGLIPVFGDETKYIEEDIIIALFPEVEEVWIRADGTVHYYAPVDFETPALRIHYLNDTVNYEDYGVWFWGDAPDQPDKWPSEAIAFSNDQVGPHGAYIDLPVNESAQSVGFLVVNLSDGEDKLTDDLRFSSFDTMNQVFITADDPGQAFTDPFYRSDEEDGPEETEGGEDISVSASVSRAFSYNEHGLLDVTIDNQSDLEVSRISADVSSIGGPSDLSISPELNRVTLSADHTIQPGTYPITVSVWDENNGRYAAQTDVTISERNKAEGERDWDEEIIYFMLTDRFADGDPTNNDPYGIDYSQADNPRGTYQGGDFKGVTENLDYLENLGVSTIWITPIVENVGHDVEYSSDDGSYYGYHGYWAKDFEELNPHLGTLEAFHDLIDQAADKGIAIMVDVVLNHAGYGLHPDNGVDDPPAGYPTDEDRARFDGMIREQGGSTDLNMELAGLPDFLTEEAAVREQLVAWQADWIDRSTTAAGNAIASFRVDTVKHVDDTTWQHFKNELIERDPAFKLIGESWGANYQNDQGYLNAGMMDSLLDFNFKSYAADFVNGRIERASTHLVNRNNVLASDATLGQFLGSHDEQGFLYSLGGDEGKLKLAASLQMTSKGQPVIYYGEELGQTGDENWPQYDNRYDFGWDLIDDNDILYHYQKVIGFRNDFSELLSRGTRETFLTSEDEDWMIVERALEDESVFLAFNTSEEEQLISVEVDSSDVIVMDHYSDSQYSAEETGDSQIITFTLPAMADGGTALLTVDNGSLIAEEIETPDDSDEPVEETEVEEGFFRIHFASLPSDDLETLGLWIWNDVKEPSENRGAWPNGATSFTEAVQTDYGWYMDIELAENPQSIGFLINSVSGNNLSGDIALRLLTSEMNQVWLDHEYAMTPYEPLLEKDMIRINYKRDNNDYDDWGIWTWDDVADPTDNWPQGAQDSDGVGPDGTYFNLALAEEAGQIGFLFLNKADGSQTRDYTFSNLSAHSQLFMREGDETIYTNPYYVSEAGMIRAELISETEIEVFFHSTEGLEEANLLEAIQLTDAEGRGVKFDAAINHERRVVSLTGDFSVERAPYTVTFDETEAEARMGWRLKDALYAYDGELGLTFNEFGTADLKVWSPSADAVTVVLYDKDDQTVVVRDDIEMTAEESGVWRVVLDEATTGLADVTGYFYHFAIERNGETVLALDPYARSMAAWNSGDPDNYVGKAAIVNPGDIGPELDYAQIDGYDKREDAIIYEIHVRDFTSDPSIEDELTSQFGTFSAFIEKLDYIESLGVTHVQLLPVMSYFFANEFENGERMMEYGSTQTNYNWGYDPQSYFSLTGMYSENPEDPARRIEEFKNLIDAIHSRGMGVILDVVYNHTAREHIFEDLEPNYYHFMDADGTSRTSFGGGRLGTTHEMARRILVDSITYWVEEYKVDGFRFDMMGDHDAESIQMAFDEAQKLNPNILMIGEGWRTFVGDEGYEDVMPADQDWMQHTQAVGSFSDDFRNELKSGFGSEGEPRFITGGARSIQRIFDNLTANPHNFTATDPGDVVPYIAAHDNLTLHDVIAQSIQKDPEYHQEEIHQRIRLGNLMVLTSQGTPFVHAGQEYGRTKQYRDPDFIEPVANDQVPYKSTFMTDEDGNPFLYPYFIHDSYDSTDAVNRFEWDKVTDTDAYPINTQTQAYTSGLIALRRSTDAFSKGTMEDIADMVSLVDAPEIEDEDLVIAYRAEDSNGDRYYIFVNADDSVRTLTLDSDLTEGHVLVDSQQAGTRAITRPEGITVEQFGVTLAPLTASVVLLTDREIEPVEENDEDGDEGTDSGSGEQPDGETEPGTDQGSDGDDPVEGGEESADLERDDEGDGQSADGTDPSEDTGGGQDSGESLVDGDQENSDGPLDGPDGEETTEAEGDSSKSQTGNQNGERLPSTATMLWTVGAVGLVSLLTGVAVRQVKKKK
ncbi:pullulanase [Alkalibacterium pelagium]|uniref:pullulanase n=1 Tax=Alkalibacterium pelagium TaxID=426702 RepID=A0A1H7JA85_9LACT|nr:pullulanase [Alkalibacterium pelagium]GEN50223.1 pullulanase [Alkalibacterium pelagium]SEK70797.1 pullulanase, extracellular [Alkalibacterium pelagium]